MLLNILLQEELLEDIKVPDELIQKILAGAQNILLAAHTLGLGAIWTGIYSMQDQVYVFKELLKVKMLCQ